MALIFTNWYNYVDDGTPGTLTWDRGSQVSWYHFQAIEFAMRERWYGINKPSLDFFKPYQARGSVFGIAWFNWVSNTIWSMLNYNQYWNYHDGTAIHGQTKAWLDARVWTATTLETYLGHGVTQVKRGEMVTIDKLIELKETLDEFVVSVAISTYPRQVWELEPFGTGPGMRDDYDVDLATAKANVIAPLDPTDVSSGSSAYPPTGTVLWIDYTSTYWASCNHRVMQLIWDRTGYETGYLYACQTQLYCLIESAYYWDDHNVTVQGGTPILEDKINTVETYDVAEDEDEIEGDFIFGSDFSPNWTASSATYQYETTGWQASQYYPRPSIMCDFRVTDGFKMKE